MALGALGWAGELCWGLLALCFPMGALNLGGRGERELQLSMEPACEAWGSWQLFLEENLEFGSCAGAWQCGAATAQVLGQVRPHPGSLNCFPH